MDALPSLRMTANLNATIHQPLPTTRAVASVVGPDVAHHLIDADGLLGLDPLAATPLAAAWPVLAAREPEMWVLTLPVPGALGALRGPVALNRAALEAGQAVVGVRAGLALVPLRVGSAVQWRALAAERPFIPPTVYEAERELGQVILSAATSLARLDVAAGDRPRDVDVELPPGYSARQRGTADRAARLLVACDAALESDGAALSVFEADSRARQLRSVRAAAGQALCAAVSWLG